MKQEPGIANAVVILTLLLGRSSIFRSLPIIAETIP